MSTKAGPFRKAQWNCNSTTNIFQRGSGYQTNVPSFPDFISKSDAVLSPCTRAQGRATLLRPDDPSGGRRGVSLMFFPTCFHAPNLPLHWCSVAGAVPHIPHSHLPHTPATFRVPLCPKIGQYQTQGHFLKINVQSSFLAAQKPCREFHPTSQSDLSAGWQLLPIMKGLLISVSKG